MSISNSKNNTIEVLPPTLNHENYVVQKWYTTKHNNDSNFEKKYSYFPVVPQNMNHVKDLCFLEYKGIDLEKGNFLHPYLCTYSTY